MDIGFEISAMEIPSSPIITQSDCQKMRIDIVKQFQGKNFVTNLQTSFS